LANPPIVTGTILTVDHATASTHEVVEREVGPDGREEAGHERVVGWNLVEPTGEDTKAGEKLWME